MKSNGNINRILLGSVRCRVPLFVFIAIFASLIIPSGCIAYPVTTSATETLIPYCWATSITSTPVQYVEVNGIRIAYRELGAGEPLLLIQGYDSVMDKWNSDFICILASEYHVYIYDNRGMGKSSDNGATPSISQYSDDAAGFIFALGYNDMNVYGSSLGSSIAQQLVIDHPETVRKLILDSNSYNFWAPECSTVLKMIQADVNDTSLPRGVRKEAEAMLSWNGSLENLSTIQKEVMLTVGTEDTYTPEELSLVMAGQINSSWLIRYENISHFGSYIAPNDYGFGVLYFLGSGKDKNYIQEIKYYSAYNN